MNIYALETCAVGCLLAFVITGVSWFQPASIVIADQQHAHWVSDSQLLDAGAVPRTCSLSDCVQKETHV